MTQATFMVYIRYYVHKMNQVQRDKLSGVCFWDMPAPSRGGQQPAAAHSSPEQSDDSDADNSSSDLA
jgi:hypothetical protein